LTSVRISSGRPKEAPRRPPGGPQEAPRRPQKDPGSPHEAQDF